MSLLTGSSITGSAPERWNNQPAAGAIPLPTTEDDMTFETFLKQCDKELIGLGCPIGIDDMPDARWRDYYDDGMCVIDALQTANDDWWDNELDPFLYG